MLIYKFKKKMKQIFNVFIYLKIYFYFAVMIPFWVIFLGKRIFSVGEMPVPYSRIGFSIVALIIPLCIGYCIQRFMPSVSRVMTRILKPLSSCLIIFIIIFATVTNLYLFKIFSWKVSFFYFVCCIKFSIFFIF